MRGDLPYTAKKIMVPDESSKSGSTFGAYASAGVNKQCQNPGVRLGDRRRMGVHVVEEGAPPQILVMMIRRCSHHSWMGPVGAVVKAALARAMEDQWDLGMNCFK
jgi:hypothetical protein